MTTLHDFMALWEDPSEAIEAQTSGSTGKPKKILLSKADMRSSARATNAYFDIGPQSVLGLPLSFDYIAGKMMAVRAALSGAELVALPVGRQVKVDRRYHLLAVVPMQLASLLSQPEAPLLVKNLLIGGAPLSAEEEKAVHAAGFNAYAGYGMTETCSHVALRRIGCEEYTAMPGISFSLDSRACLVIRARHFSWAELVTNDVVQLLDDTHFRWLGRIDNVVNSGGIKLHIEQLEAEYRAVMPSLPPFYLKGEPSATYGQQLVMVIAGSADGIEGALRQHFGDSRRLPKRYVEVTALPLTESGKIRRV